MREEDLITFQIQMDSASLYVFLWVNMWSLKILGIANISALSDSQGYMDKINQSYTTYPKRFCKVSFIKHPSVKLIYFFAMYFSVYSSVIKW